MKTEICVIKRTHPDGTFSHVIEIGRNICLPLTPKEVEEVISNAGLTLQDTHEKTEGGRDEYYY